MTYKAATIDVVEDMAGRILPANNLVYILDSYSNL